MNSFDRDRPTKKVRMYPGHRPGYPNSPGHNSGFTRDETSSIHIDSEAILEARNARPPLPPRTPANRSAQAAPKAAILRIPHPKKRG